MKKRRVLKKWVKVVLSIVLLIVCVKVYGWAGDLGMKADDSLLACVGCMYLWAYLFFGQVVLFTLVWSN